MVPWPFSFVLAVLITVSVVLVSFATQLVVPIVLIMLSVVFGRSMRDAADTVREAGKAALEGIHRARQWLRGESPDPARQSDLADADRASPTRDGTSSAPPERGRNSVDGTARARVASDPAGSREEDPSEEDDRWEQAERRARR
jgi:hypothetical protein